MNNNRGWIRIVEASVAILFLAGVFLLILNQGNIEIGESVLTQEMYDSQIEILREVQTNESLRASIIGVNTASLPVHWDDAEFPGAVKTKVEEETQSSFTCEASICSVSDSCVLENAEETNIYSEFTIISVTTTQPETQGYTPRKFKLFCWQ